MKRLFFLLICSTIFCNQNYSERYWKAWQDANSELQNLSLRQQDMRHLIEYMEYYSSWYAAVTPASAELTYSLPHQALDFVARIKQIVKPLEKKPDRRDRRLMGATRLSLEGKAFYRNFIQKLKDSYNVSKKRVY
jgi:hypothetical protein